MTIFWPSLRRNDIWAIVIRGHLRIEAALNKAIRESLGPFEELERLHFEQKIILVIATGHLEKEAKGGFLFLNKIRNWFAHDPDYQLTQKDVRNFWNSFSGSIKQTIETLNGNDIRTIIAHYILALHIELHAVAEVEQ